MWAVVFFLLLRFGCYVQGKEYKVLVTTSRWMFQSGTDANVHIKLFGTVRDLGPRKLDDANDNFEKGRTDTFIFQDRDVGYVNGIQIKRDNAGFYPRWHLKEVVVQVVGEEDSIFHYDNWVKSNEWTTLTLFCRIGYGINKQKYCSDVNECIVGKHKCDLKRSTCVNLKGSYACYCRPGYQYESSQCKDVNECAVGNHKCDLKTTTCVNSEGSFTCPCRTGYQKESAYTCKAPTCDPDVYEPLGMESGQISNASITASSYYRGYEPDKARLNARGGKAWYAVPWDASPWIQVDLGKLAWLKGVATQGKRFTLFVKTFKLAYSLDASSWSTYNDSDDDDGETAKIFNGNSDPYKAVTHKLIKPVYARYVRLNPQTCNHGVALKLELYGCIPPKRA